MNFPAGPSRLADFVGLDVALAVLQHMQEAFGDKFKPCPLLIEKAKNGHLGIKTKKGFYDYQETSPNHRPNRLSPRM